MEARIVLIFAFLGYLYGFSLLESNQHHTSRKSMILDAVCSLLCLFAVLILPIQRRRSTGTGGGAIPDSPSDNMQSWG